jgi:hypothetical protein
VTFNDPVFRALNDFDIDDMSAQADISRRMLGRLEDIDNATTAGPTTPAARAALATSVVAHAGRVHLGGRAMLPAWLNRAAPGPARDRTTLAQGRTASANPGRCGRSGRRGERDHRAPAGPPGARRSVGADVLFGGQRARDHEDNAAPDLHGVIGKALVEAA